MFNNIICPISAKKVDSNVSRLTVFFNAILMTFFLVTLNPILLFIVSLDYGIRAWGFNKYSPLCILASIVVKLLRLETKMVDKAPKMFASRLGFICAALGLVFIMLDMPVSSIIVIALFDILAILDSVFNFCVGCLIYHHFVFPFYSKG